MSFKSAVHPLTSLLLALTLVPATTVPAATPAVVRSFHIQDQWNIGGKGGWGFLSFDSSAHQLFIPRTDRISVLDTTTGKTLTEIEGMGSLRNVALDDTGRYGYATDVTDGSAGFVRVFDRNTFKLVASVPTGPIPFAIVFDPATKSVFAFSSREHTVSVINTTANKLVGTIKLDGRPGSAIGDGKGGVFVALPAQGVVQRIDATSMKITATWQLAPCTGPSGLTVDALHHQLFTTCEDHKLIAINADTGHTTPIGDAPPNASDLDFDARSNLLFIADPAGSLIILRRDSALRFSRVQDVKTQPGARTMAVDHTVGKVYLATAKFGLNSSTVSEELHYRPTPIPGTFSVIVVAH